MPCFSATLRAASSYGFDFEQLLIKEAIRAFSLASFDAAAFRRAFAAGEGSAVYVISQST